MRVRSLLPCVSLRPPRAPEFPLFTPFDKLAYVPALKPVAGVLKMRFLHDIGTDNDAGTHLFFQTVQAPTQAQLDSLTAAAHAAYLADCAGMLNNLSSLTQIEAWDLSDPAGPFSINAVAIPGTRAGQAPPANAVALMNIPVVRRYRGGKPRAYWPWGSTADIANPQQWSATFVQEALTAYAALQTAILNNLRTWASSANLCSVSYFEDGEWKPDHLGNYHRIPTPRATPYVDQIKGGPSISITFGSARRRLRPN